MKKLYIKPLTEVVTYNLETFIAASDTPEKVSDVSDLDDVTVAPKENNPTNFSKQYDLWEFDEN